VFNPQTVNVGYIRSIEAATPLPGVQAIKTPVRDPLELVRAIDAFAAEPNGGLLVVPVLPEDSYQCSTGLRHSTGCLPFTPIGGESSTAA
jgi:hypothetical protein